MLLQSCEDFLEVDLPADQTTKALIFKDANLANSAMSGLLRSISENGFLAGSSTGGGVLLGCYTDDLLTYAASSIENYRFYTLNIQPSNSGILNLWQTTYNQIYGANSIITGVEESDFIDKKIKNQLIGEALFIRSLLHLYLVNSYGKIPYVMTIDYVNNNHLKSLEPNEIYKYIEGDLLKSIEMLSTDGSLGSRIRPTKSAAIALLSRLYLNMGYWQKAIEASKQIVGDASYVLEQDITKVFLKESKSIIWAFQPLTSDANTKEGLTYILRSAPPTSVALTSSLLSCFEPEDLRKKNWIENISDAKGNRYHYANKYKIYGSSGTSKEYSVVLRVEEQYLNLAEALLHVGQIEASLEYLNIIRKRAGLTILSNITSEKLAEEILLEKRREFFTEFGHRFYDLKRFRQLNIVMKKEKDTWSDRFENLPLPESELLINPFLGPQNDGY